MSDNCDTPNTNLSGSTQPNVPLPHIGPTKNLPPHTPKDMQEVDTNTDKSFKGSRTLGEMSNSERKQDLSVLYTQDALKKAFQSIDDSHTRARKEGTEFETPEETRKQAERLNEVERTAQKVFQEIGNTSTRPNKSTNGIEIGTPTRKNSKVVDIFDVLNQKQSQSVDDAGVSTGKAASEQEEVIPFNPTKKGESYIFVEKMPARKTESLIEDGIQTKKDEVIEAVEEKHTFKTEDLLNVSTNLIEKLESGFKFPATGSKGEQAVNEKEKHPTKTDTVISPESLDEKTEFQIKTGAVVDPKQNVLITPQSKDSKDSQDIPVEPDNASKGAVDIIDSSTQQSKSESTVFDHMDHAEKKAVETIVNSDGLPDQDLEYVVETPMSAQTTGNGYDQDVPLRNKIQKDIVVLEDGISKSTVPVVPSPFAVDKLDGTKTGSTLNELRMAWQNYQADYNTDDTPTTYDSIVALAGSTEFGSNDILTKSADDPVYQSASVIFASGDDRADYREAFGTINTYATKTANASTSMVGVTTTRAQNDGGATFTISAGTTHTAFHGNGLVVKTPAAFSTALSSAYVAPAVTNATVFTNIDYSTFPIGTGRVASGSINSTFAKTTGSKVSAVSGSGTITLNDKDSIYYREAVAAAGNNAAIPAVSFSGGVARSAFGSNHVFTKSPGVRVSSIGSSGVRRTLTEDSIYYSDTIQTLRAADATLGISAIPAATIAFPSATTHSTFYGNTFAIKTTGSMTSMINSTTLAPGVTSTTVFTNPIYSAIAIPAVAASGSTPAVAAVPGIDFVTGVTRVELGTINDSFTKHPGVRVSAIDNTSTRPVLNEDSIYYSSTALTARVADTTKGISAIPAAVVDFVHAVTTVSSGASSKVFSRTSNQAANQINAARPAENTINTTNVPTYVSAAIPAVGSTAAVPAVITVFASKEGAVATKNSVASKAANSGGANFLGGSDYGSNTYNIPAIRTDINTVAAKEKSQSRDVEFDMAGAGKGILAGSAVSALVSGFGMETAVGSVLNYINIAQDWTNVKNMFDGTKVFTVNDNALNSTRVLAMTGAPQMLHMAAMNTAIYDPEAVANGQSIGGTINSVLGAVSSFASQPVATIMQAAGSSAWDVDIAKEYMMMLYHPYAMIPYIAHTAGRKNPRNDFLNVAVSGHSGEKYKSGNEFSITNAPAERYNRTKTNQGRFGKTYSALEALRKNTFDQLIDPTTKTIKSNINGYGSNDLKTSLGIDNADAVLLASFLDPQDTFKSDGIVETKWNINDPRSSRASIRADRGTRKPGKDGQSQNSILFENETVNGLFSARWSLGYQPWLSVKDGQTPSSINWIINPDPVNASPIKRVGISYSNSNGVITTNVKDFESNGLGGNWLGQSRDGTLLTNFYNESFLEILHGRPQYAGGTNSTNPFLDPHFTNTPSSINVNIGKNKFIDKLIAAKNAGTITTDPMMFDMTDAQKHNLYTHFFGANRDADSMKDVLVVKMNQTYANHLAFTANIHANNADITNNPKANALWFNTSGASTPNFIDLLSSSSVFSYTKSDGSVESNAKVSIMDNSGISAIINNHSHNNEITMWGPDYLDMHNPNPTDSSTTPNGVISDPILTPYQRDGYTFDANTKTHAARASFNLYDGRTAEKFSFTHLGFMRDGNEVVIQRERLKYAIMPGIMPITNQTKLNYVKNGTDPTPVIENETGTFAKVFDSWSEVDGGNMDNNEWRYDFEQQKTYRKNGAKTGLTSLIRKSDFKQKLIEARHDNTNDRLGHINIHTSVNSASVESKVIPFQFNPEISGESRSASWQAHSAIGRTQEFFIWGSTSSRTVQFRTSLLIMAPEGANSTTGSYSGDADILNKIAPNSYSNKNVLYDGWMANFTPVGVQSILNLYRSLLVPATDKAVPRCISFSDQVLIWSKFQDDGTKKDQASRWIVTELNIDPKLEAGYAQYSHDVNGATVVSKIPMAYDVTLMLKEVYESWDSYQDSSSLGR
jgi:hypothetical protein